jgi:hypothetical protein
VRRDTPCERWLRVEVPHTAQIAFAFFSNVCEND